MKMKFKFLLLVPFYLCSIGKSQESIWLDCSNLVGEEEGRTYQVSVVEIIPSSLGHPGKYEVSFFETPTNVPYLTFTMVACSRSARTIMCGRGGGEDPSYALVRISWDPARDNIFIKAKWRDSSYPVEPSVAHFRGKFLQCSLTKEKIL